MGRHALTGEGAAGVRRRLHERVNAEAFRYAESAGRRTMTAEDVRQALGRFLKSARLKDTNEELLGETDLPGYTSDSEIAFQLQSS